MAVTLVAITGTLKKFDETAWGNARVKVRLVTDVATDTGVAYPVWSLDFLTESDGTIPDGTQLAAPPSGSWRYWCQIESNEPFEFPLTADAASLSIAQLVALAGQSGSGAAATLLAIGGGASLVWRYPTGATPPTTASALQTLAGVDTAVAAGHLCITINGDIYKCTNATNQAALVWLKALFLTEAGQVIGTTLEADATGTGADALVALTDSGTGGVIGSSAGTYNVLFGYSSPSRYSGIRRSNGVLAFIGASAATNRNAQLAELFASIPPSPGASGTLWNDGGTIKKVP